MSSRRPLKVDLHTHILPENWPDLRARYGEGNWVQLVHPGPDGRLPPTLLHASSSTSASSSSSTAAPTEGGYGPNYEHRSCMTVAGKYFRSVDPNLFSPEARLSDCDLHGVDVQVLSTVPIMFSYWASPEHAADLSRVLNDDLAQVVSQHPKRFVGLATVAMQAPTLAAEEVRRIAGIGLAGIQIGTHIAGVTLDDRSLDPVWDALAETGGCVFVHPWDMMGADRNKYWSPWLVSMPAETSQAILSLMLGGVFSRYPAVRFCFAHGGGSFPFTVGRIQHGWDCRPDLCAKDEGKRPREFLGHFWVDSLTHDARALEFLVDLVGEERVILGTDYPFPLGEQEPGKLIESMTHWTVEKREALLSRNAFAFLGLKEADFRRD